MKGKEFKIQIALGTLKGYIVTTPEGEWTPQHEVVYTPDLDHAKAIAKCRGGWLVAGKYCGKDYDLT